MPKRIPCVRLLTWLAIVAACASSVFAQRQPAGERPQPPRDQAPPRAELARPKPPAGQPRPPAGFALTPAEQRLLDQVLLRWEKSSDTVKTFKCDFSRLDFDTTFGPKENRFKRAEGTGTIKYKRPDHGDYEITESKEWVPPKPPAKEGRYEKMPDGREHWVCDGKSIFQFEFAKKVLRETKLPPELQGAAIADGPVPFVFGAKAEQLKRRYFLKDITPPEDVKDFVWLEAQPRFQQDAANFECVQVILTIHDFMPYALQVFLPGGTKKTVYKFEKIATNSKFEWITRDFATPTAPFGWKHVVEKPPAAPGAPNDKQRPPADGAEARRSGTNPRK